METYKSCGDLPIKNFIKTFITGELAWLYKERQVHKKHHQDKNELKLLWDNILGEYTDLLGRNASATLFQYLKELTIIKNRFMIVKDILEYLSQNAFDKNSARLISLLKEYGFQHQYSPINLQEDLKQTFKEVFQVLIRKQDTDREQNAIVEPKDHPKEIHFNNIIAYLNQFMGFKIDRNKTSTLEFIAHLEMYNSHYKNQLKK